MVVDLVVGLELVEAVEDGGFGGGVLEFVGEDVEGEEVGEEVVG